MTSITTVVPVDGQAVAETLVHEGVVVEAVPSMSDIQSKARRAVRLAHGEILKAQQANDKGALAIAKDAMRAALRASATSVRVDVLEIEDNARKAKADLAEMEAVVKTYKSTTLSIVGLAALDFGATDIARDLFGMTGSTESRENNTLQKRVTRLAIEGATYALASEAKGKALTVPEMTALKAAAPTSLKAARAQTFTPEAIAASVAPSEPKAPETPESVATKALAKADNAIAAASSALLALQAVADNVPADKTEDLAKILAKVEALVTLWTTPAEIEPTEAEIEAIESETA